jgi:hypothetical protein
MEVMRHNGQLAAHSIASSASSKLSQRAGFTDYPVHVVWVVSEPIV